MDFRLSRRRLLQRSAMVSLAPAGAAWAPAPKKGGTLRVGFYVEAATMDYVQPRDVAAVKPDKNVVVLDVPSPADFAYQLNHTRPPFDPRVREQGRGA